MEIKNYIMTVDNFLPYESLSSLIQWANKQNNKFKKAEIFLNNQKPEIREDIRKVDNFGFDINSKSKTEIHWSSYLTYYFTNLCENYQKHFKVKASLSGLTDITFLRYQNGGHYKTHTDHCKNAPRTLSIIYLLNNDYEGGELIFKLPDGKDEIFKIEKKPNRVVIWPSNFLYPHQVTPVTKGLRYSIVSWAL
jgi:Rps23 Pro-64 3,4-dihydroxylase Tpa1-like proline 4-hydroxylase